MAGYCLSQFIADTTDTTRAQQSYGAVHQYMLSTPGAVAVQYHSQWEQITAPLEVFIARRGVHSSLTRELALSVLSKPMMVHKNSSRGRRDKCVAGQCVASAVAPLKLLCWHICMLRD